MSTQDRRPCEAPEDKSGANDKTALDRRRILLSNAEELTTPRPV